MELPPAPDASIDNRLSFVANSERKAVLQLLVAPGDEIEVTELNARFADAQDPDCADGLVRYAYGMLAQTITRSLGPAGGFIVRDTGRYSEWLGCKVPDSALNDAIAGQALGLSADFGIALEKLFGKSSATGGARSPEIRIRLFRTLAGLAVGDNITLGEIAEDASTIRTTVYRHIDALFDMGLVHYEATSLQGRPASFSIVGDPDPALSTQTKRGDRLRRQAHYAHDATHRVKIGRALLAMQEAGVCNFTYASLADALNAPAGSLRVAIGVMLREGVIERNHLSPHARDAFSRVTLDDGQKAIIKHISAVTQGLRRQDPGVIGEGLALGATIMDDKPLVSELLHRAYDNSSAIGRLGYARNAALFETLLAAGPLTSRAIRNLIDGQLTVGGVAQTLARMRDQGRVTSVFDRNVTVWSLPT